MTEEKKEEHHTSHKDKDKKTFTQKVRENPWIISTVVLAVLVLIMLIFGSNGSSLGKTISSDEAGQNLVAYLNTQTGGGVSFVSSEPFDDSPFYEVVVSYNGENIPVYATRDGKYYSSQLVPIQNSAVQNDSSIN